MLSMPSSSFSSPSFSAKSPISSSLSSSSSPSLDSVFTSVHHLLSRALSLPCSTAAQAFTQLVQPTLRFQLALDVLLPLLEGDLESDPASPGIDDTHPNGHVGGHGRNQTAQRILVSFVLFSLYAPHPISINPFRSALYMTFVKEREKAIRVASPNASGQTKLGNGGDTGTAVTGTPSNEQLVWVLWKILRGDGNDIGPYTPTTLARSPLPPKLAAINLVLDEANDNDLELPYISASKAGSGSAFNLNTGGSAPAANTSSEDFENAALTHGMTLILAARERVLSLSERRTLEPILPALAALDIITPLDLTAIITLNSDVAYPLFVEMLIASVSSPSNFLDILDVLPYLPASLSTFDLMGRLLRDTRPVPLPAATPHLHLSSENAHRFEQMIDNDDRVPLGQLVYSQVLSRFIHECIERLEREERERMEVSGGSSDGDDAWGRGVRNLCRFYLSLIKLGIVPLAHGDKHTLPSQPQASTSVLSDDWETGYDAESFSAESVEIAHFALRNSRFEEARVLYGVLVTGRLDG
ncbi:hypothetical protein GYMLUDRAFT_55925 [Collybiopsis luxurians FD-317 M1]|nr:hypothetical protein GYMLUDRAFT_55925 [Collybiopsis luxurians FD-317 M1]